MPKRRKYVYIGAPVPAMPEREYAAFYLHFQRAILLSLRQRGLLTELQAARCMEELEKQYQRLPMDQHCENPRQRTGDLAPAEPGEPAEPPATKEAVLCPSPNTNY